MDLVMNFYTLMDLWYGIHMAIKIITGNFPEL